MQIYILFCEYPNCRNRGFFVTLPKNHRISITMATNKNFSIGRVLSLIGVILVFIFSLGLTLYFAGISITPWWIPVLVCVLIAAASGAKLWKVWQGLTQSKSFLPNFICNLLFSTFLLTSAYYILNSVIPVGSTKENVEVISKFREKHYRSERVGKNSYKRGAPYYTYHISVKLPNNREKNIQLPHSTYSRIKSGEEIRLVFTKGCLGETMIDTSTILQNNPQLAKPERKRKRCRFFGTHG